MRASAQEKDTIILYNGQILIGEVQQSNLGVISIDDIDMKIVNIKLFKIKRLVIRERFKIETIGKEFYFGSMRTTDREGWVDIHTVDGATIPLHITHIFELISLEHGFFRRMNGNISAGLSFTKSSGIGQINFSAFADYPTKLFDYQLSLNSIGSIDSGRFSRDNENAQLLVTYDLTSSWFLATSLQYQRNLELSIDSRYLLMTGAGNKLFIRKNWRLMAITGISVSEENSTEGTSSSALFEVPISLIFNFYRFQNPDIQITSTQTVYFSLTQQGRVRFNSNTSFAWQLIRYFYLNISPYTNFDNQPPGGSSTNFDYGIVLGLSYKF
ncbi:MAG TPA: DUF481 domain-containing protein [Puia sp.]